MTDTTKFEMDRTRSLYNQCVKLGLCDAADGYRDEMVALRKTATEDARLLAEFGPCVTRSWDELEAELSQPETAANNQQFEQNSDDQANDAYIADNTYSQHHLMMNNGI